MIQNTVSAKDLRLNLTKYLKLIDQGNSFIIIKRSTPIGRITPLLEENKNDKEAKIEKIMSYAGCFSDINAKEWIKRYRKNRKIKTRKIPSF